MKPSNPSPLPAGYRALRTLAQGPQHLVLEAEGLHGRVALRLESGSQAGQGRAELQVLSEVVHPGLARLVDHGTLEQGGFFLARAWIEGRELLDAGKGRSLLERAQLVAKLGFALEHLHRRGFVHGDLKSANVLVTEEGDPVLCDFGLSRAVAREVRDDAPAQGSGSYLYAAPEVLAGCAATASSDLFSLGVLLHELLAPGPRDLARIYAEFPGRSWLDALGTREQLPSWAIPWIERLCARDPGERPASAAYVGHGLAASCGFEVEAPMPAPAALRVPVLLGREDWALERMSQILQAGISDTWLLDAREDRHDLVAELVLQGILAGIPVHALDIEGWNLLSTAQQDQRLRQAREAEGLVLLFAAKDPADQAQQAWERVRGGKGTLTLASSASTEGAPLLPPLKEADLLAFLQRHVEPEDDPRLATLAERLHVESRGVGSQVRELLADSSELWREGTPMLCLRPGPLPREAGRRRRRETVRVSEEVRPLLEALSVRGEGCTWSSLAAVLEWNAARLQLHGREAIEQGWVRVSRRGEQTLLRIAPGLAWTPEASESERAEWHRRWAERYLQEPTSPRNLWYHRVRADGLGQHSATLRTELETFQGGNRPGLAMAALEGCREALGERDEAFPNEWEAELAYCEAQLGLSAEAQRRCQALGASEIGRVAWVEALVAAWRQDFALAAERMQVAHAEGVAAQVDLDLALLRVAYEKSEWAQVQQFAEPWLATLDELTPRQRVNLLGLSAMAAFYQGQVELARDRLMDSLRRARADEADLHEASVHVNLGLIARHLKEFGEAREHFQAALSSYTAASFLPGRAQVQGLLAGVLRELGELRSAEALLTEGLDTCLRLGNPAGGLVQRGMLGLVLAQRGVLQPAIQQLRAAAQELRQSGSDWQASILLARALELEARRGPLDLAGDDAQFARSGIERDPRIALWLGRGAWHTEQESIARELWSQGVEAATKLGRAALIEELEGALQRVAHHDAPNGELEALLLRDPLPIQALVERAERELEQGANATALRLLLAVAARGEGEAAHAARGRCKTIEESTFVGLGQEQIAVYRQRLLDWPDPCPADLDPEPRLAESEADQGVTTILEINRRLVEQQDLTTLLGAIVDAALEVSGAERGFVVLEERGELILDLAFESRRGDIAAPEVEVSHSILREALGRQEPLRVSNASTDPDLAQAPSVNALHLRSVLCQPFSVESGVRGVIYLDDRLRADAFGDRAERLLGLLAGQAALAIRQVRRLEEIRTLNEELGREVTAKESEALAAQRALEVVGAGQPVTGMVGSSAAMREVHALLRRVAPTPLTVWIYGPSGSGKELAARALHDLSDRSDGPFVSENSAALPPSLVESELFGYVPGAFTGAEREAPGLFERAHGGTLFLDEVAELPLEIQAKLLRVLETRSVRRLGDKEQREVDFRLVVASHRDLHKEVQEGRFREDLLYRLDGVRVVLPSLAERMEDLPELIDHFLRLQRRRDGITRRVHSDVLRAMGERAWPGNVRELSNEVARLCVLSAGDLDDPSLLRPALTTAPMASPMEGPSALRTLADLEREAIERALEQCDGDKRRAAECLGISRAKLYQRLKQWREESS